MNFPIVCEVCGSKEGFLERGALDFDGFVGENRRADQIHECLQCHTLYRSRWEMVSFTRLFESLHEIEGNKQSAIYYKATEAEEPTTRPIYGWSPEDLARGRT